ncbi:MAG: hypothetical protein P8L82_01775 [Paracoccaceae bacterium]|nr:hypothetical protein [Paracoccaceae bacterium]
MENKKKGVGHKHQLDGMKYTEDSVKETERKKLQDFYSSVLGSDPEEVKINSLAMRRKIYSFGLILLVGACIFYFLVLGKISFVTS